MSEADPRNFGRLTLLISHDRSGSHYLGSFIRAVPNHRMVDEICNEQALDPVRDPLSFFGFRYARSLETPDYALRRTPAVVSNLLDDYFSFALASSPPGGLTIDIKYGHIHNFEVAWWPIFRKPFLFEYAGSRGIGIIHLSRWNSLETVVSGEVAEARKVWHAVGAQKPAGPADAIKVDKKQLVRQIEMLNDQKAAIFRWTRNLRCLPILYEELVDTVEGSACRARIAEFLGSVPPPDFSSSYNKVTPPMHLMIRNWHEISSFCRENDLSHYLLGLPRWQAPLAAKFQS